MSEEESEEIGVEAPADAKRGAPPQSRLIVNQTVLFALPNRGVQEVASHADGSFIRLMDSKAMPYRRELEIGEEWQPLDWGWAGPNPSQVIICNEEGMFFNGVPTPEQKAEAMGRIVDIGVETFRTGAWLDRFPDEKMFSMGVDEIQRVRPLQSCRFEPEEETNYFIRCRKGKARITLAVTPGDGT